MSNLDVANHFGYEIQSEQLVEECAELIQAVSKYRRARGKGRVLSPILEPSQADKDREQVALANLVEEIADVENMLEQIKYLLQIPQGMIDGIKEIKAERIKI